MKAATNVCNVVDVNYQNASSTDSTSKYDDDKVISALMKCHD